VYETGKTAKWTQLTLKLMKRKEYGYITNRLLYQLSYVGLHSILNVSAESVKRTVVARP